MLTKDQLLMLRTHIQTSLDPRVISARDSRNDTELAKLYNENSTMYVWRTRITPDEYRSVLDWTEIDNLSVGKARVWSWATQEQTGDLDASNDNLRAGIAQAFGINSNTTQALSDLAKRFASLGESVFAVGVGTENSPAKLDFEGVVTIDDIGRAMNG